MPTERQVIALLTLLGSVAALSFAAYNVYLAFSNNTLQVAKK